ncbi:MAG TPA: site-specific integrase, partial [Gemmataceae bacterium]|nr:site-specific integrase [Gemmataceae bacterium]
MGKVFKTTYTKPLPAGAEVFVREDQRFARWKSRAGKIRKAKIVIGRDGTDRVEIESPFYFARYRDGADVVRIVPTGCKDETAARAVLGELERRAEHVRSGIMTANEESAVQHLTRPIEEHRVAYVERMRTEGLSSKYRSETGQHLTRIFADCKIAMLRDLDRERFEQWLASLIDAGASPRTRNCYRDDLVTFAKWCIETGRLVENPLAAIGKLNVEIDRRRTRRAMTEAELVKLLDVARRRPIEDAQTIRRGARVGKAIANLKPETIATLDRLGRERALLYKALVLTGLRKNELASLTVAQLDLDGPVPFAILNAADEKNREGSEIVLRADLAADLRGWLAEKLADLQTRARQAGDPIPLKLPADTRVFTVPAALVKILDRDLKAAGIPKRDERGRTLDVHALRTTFGTLMSKGGVAPRTAQAAMRHSDIRLTMQTYTDPKLLDVRGAVEALPDLPLTGGRPTSDEAIAATGTDGSHPRALVRTLVRNGDCSGRNRSAGVRSASRDGSADGTGERDA